MKTLFTLFLFTVSSHFSLRCQGNFLPFIRFHSQFEKEAWNAENRDVLNFFSSIDSTVVHADVDQFKKRLEEFYATHTYTFVGKKRLKEIKDLYLKVHQEFLLRYREIIYFPELMRKGEFNCMTATVLYSIILDHYSVPCAIIEEPNHVYLVAFPEEEYAVLETTSPNFDAFQSTKKIRENVVKDMLQNKLITTLEVDTLGLNRSFEMYFRNKNRSSISELLAFHYINEMAKMEKEKSIDGGTYFELALRAKHLLPKRQTNILDINTLALGQLGASMFSNERVRQVWFYTLTDEKFNEDLAEKLIQAILAISYSKYNGESYLAVNEEVDLDEQILTVLRNREAELIEFCNAPKWRQALLENYYGYVLYNFEDLLDEELEEEMISKFSQINPKNKYVQYKKLEAFRDKMYLELYENPKGVKQILTTYSDSIKELEVNDEVPFNFELSVLTQTAEKLYLDRQKEKGDYLFMQIMDTYNSNKASFDPYLLKSFETDFGFLMLHRADCYERDGDYSGARKTLKIGRDLLPNNKAVASRYKSSLR